MLVAVFFSAPVIENHLQNIQKFFSRKNISLEFHDTKTCVFGHLTATHYKRHLKIGKGMIGLLIEHSTLKSGRQVRSSTQDCSGLFSVFSSFLSRGVLDCSTQFQDRFPRLQLEDIFKKISANKCKHQKMDLVTIILDQNETLEIYSY